MGPLLIHLPTRDMLCFIPALSSLVLNNLLVYWNPLSLWNKGWASGYLVTAKSKVSKTSLLLLFLPMANETIPLSLRSRIALRYSFSPFPYLNSVTSVSHFSLSPSAVNSLFKMFSAVISGVERWYFGLFLRITACSPTICVSR